MRHASPAKQPGKAVISGRNEVECTIRDLSSLGARLKFSHPTFLPRQFRLVFDDSDQKVTVIWQAGVVAGVRFQTPLPQSAHKQKSGLALVADIGRARAPPPSRYRRS